MLHNAQRVCGPRHSPCALTRPAAAGCCTSTGPEAVSRIPPVARTIRRWHRWKHRDEHDKLHRLLVDVLNVPSRAQRASAGSPIGRIMAASKSIASAQLVEEAAAIVLVHRHQRQSTCWSTLKALGRPNAAVCLLAVPVDALCSWSRRQLGVVVVLAQLQNHCRSRETCSFGTPDAVVCKAARPASAALAAVGERVGIAERAGAVVL